MATDQTTPEADAPAGAAGDDKLPQQTGDTVKDMHSYRQHHGMDRVFGYLLQVWFPSGPEQLFSHSPCTLVDDDGSSQQSLPYEIDEAGHAERRLLMGINSIRNSGITALIGKLRRYGSEQSGISLKPCPLRPVFACSHFSC